MSRAILLSIHPERCATIALWRATIEIKKSCPKIKVPLKCYIYCTDDKRHDLVIRDKGAYIFGKIAEIAKEHMTHSYIGNGCVIGEFICDDIIVDLKGENADVFEKQGLMSLADQKRYGKNKPLYGWHISDLVIYDKPRELNEFVSLCPDYYKVKFTARCHKCSHFFKSDADCYAYCNIDGEKQITRPPQSWCYVEKLA